MLISRQDREIGPAKAGLAVRTYKTPDQRLDIKSCIRVLQECDC